MPASWFYHNYPKAAAKATKAIIIWLTASIIIGFVIDLLNKGKKIMQQPGRTVAGEFRDAFHHNKSLLITIAIVALAFLIFYFILERTGIIIKIGKWYSNTQSSLTTFTERPTSRDFNELGD